MLSGEKHLSARQPSGDQAASSLLETRLTQVALAGSVHLGHSSQLASSVRNRSDNQPGASIAKTCLGISAIDVTCCSLQADAGMPCLTPTLPRVQLLRFCSSGT